MTAAEILTRTWRPRRYRNSTKINTIHNQLQAYVSGFGDEAGTAVISELLQNADDAGASTVVFRFLPDALEVCNDSVFTEDDFDNITELMSRGKERESGKTGAFGTGFISTYHLTDSPHLESSGEWMVFDPTRDSLEGGPSFLENSTRFRFRWRREETLLSRSIGARTWSDADVVTLRDSLSTILYRLTIFLRHVHQVEVYDGEHRLCTRITRKLVETCSLDNLVRQRWDISVTGADGQTVVDSWLYYTTTLSQDQAPTRFTVKDFDITLAFPLKQRTWLQEHVPSTLYNLLPTSIRTGLGFHINGSFFPSDNRRSILLDAAMQTEKTAWNQYVLRSLGSLFVAAAIDIRDEVREAARLYQLLPLTYEQTHGFLKPIIDLFRDAARSLPVIWSTRSQWVTPDKVSLTTGADLYALVEHHIDLMPQKAEPLVRDLVQQLGAATFSLDTLLDTLTPQLASGIIPGSGKPHPFIDSRAKLTRLYKAMQRVYDALTTSDARSAWSEQMATLPLFLAEDGALYDGCCDDNLWCANEESRALELSDLVRFVDQKMQNQFPFLKELLLEFSGSPLLGLIPVRDDFQAETLTLGNAELPRFMRSRAALERTLRFIAHDLSEIDIDDVIQRPLVLDTQERLWITDAMVRRPTDDSQELLSRFGIPFIDGAFYADSAIRSLYDQAGIRAVDVSDVVTALSVFGSTPQKMRGQGLPTLHEIRRLLDYLSRHHDAQRPGLSNDDIARLRTLAFIPTSGKRLAPLDGEMPLVMAERGQDALQTILLEVLHLDVLIAPELLRGNVSGFLREVLGVEELTPEGLIRTYVLPRYHQQAISDDGRYTLLMFLRDRFADPQQRTTILALLDRASQGKLALVRFQDAGGVDGYSAAQPIYFDTELVRSVLGDDFRRPHPQYDRTWVDFFNALGVKQQPPPLAMANHLLRLVEIGEQPSVALYAALADTWSGLDKERQALLRQAPIFPAAGQLWSAAQILSDEHMAEFGSRRAYRGQLSGSGHRALFDKIQPKPPSLTWRDYVAFLEEIASAAGGQPLGEEDRELVRATMARLAPGLWPDLARLNEAACEELRRKPLVLNASGRLCSASMMERSIKIADGPGAGNTIPALLLGKVDVVADAIARDGRSFLTEILRIDTITPFAVARDVFVSVYNAYPDHTDRLLLLAFLRDLWENLSPNQRRELSDRLEEVALIRCDNDTYEIPYNISFRTEELDRIFVGGHGVPPYPHPSYAIPLRTTGDATWERAPWVTLFRDLGVYVDPYPTDIVTAVKEIVAGGSHPTTEQVRTLEPIYTWLRDHADEMEPKDEAQKALAELANFAWIPAQRGGTMAWYQPGQVYARDDAVLIGTQGAILAFRPNPNERLQKLLGFPGAPPAALVAGHLIAIGAQNKSTEPAGLARIYPFLSRNWEKLDGERQQQLRTQPVVWYNRQFWKAAQVIPMTDDSDMSQLRRLFGARRACMRPGQEQDFLAKIGARYDPLASHLDLLRDIVSVYQGNLPITPADHDLLLCTFDYLGRKIGDNAPADIAALRAIPCLPGQDGRLYSADDIVIAETSRPDLVRRFKETGIAILADQLEGVGSPNGKEGQAVSLTEQGFRLLRRLGLPLLTVGDGVERRLVEAEQPVENSAHANWFYQLMGPLRRINRTLHDRGFVSRVPMQPLDVLAQMNVVVCRSLRVCYSVRLASGRHIEVPEAQNERVLYNYDATTDTHRLYLVQKRDRQPYLTDLAVEFERLFFPGSQTSPTIEALLKLDSITQIDHYLNKHNFLTERGQAINPWEDDDEDEQEAPPAPTSDTLIPPDEDATERPGIVEEIPEPTEEAQVPQVSVPVAVSSSMVAQTSIQSSPSRGSSLPAHRSTSRTTTSSTSKGHRRTPAPVVEVERRDWAPVCAVVNAPRAERPFQPGPHHTHTASPRSSTPTTTASRDRDEGTAKTALDHLSQQAKVQIGRWGEEYVLSVLHEQLHARYPQGQLVKTVDGFTINQGKSVFATVQWLNAGNVDCGQGYDIRLIEGGVTFYIEVKTTIEDQKEWFQLSPYQWEFARDHRQHFRIYRVFNAGTPSATFQVISDPVQRWEAGEIRIHPVRIYI